MWSPDVRWSDVLLAERAPVLGLQLRARRHRDATRATSTTSRRRRAAASRPACRCAAYDHVLKCSHAFNLLDSRRAIAVTDRAGYILRMRRLAQAVAPRLPRPVEDARCLTCSSRSAARSCRPRAAAMPRRSSPGLLDAELARAGICPRSASASMSPRGGWRSSRSASRRAARPSAREVRGPRADAPEQALAGLRAQARARRRRRSSERDGFVWACPRGADAGCRPRARRRSRRPVEGIQFSKPMRWDGGRFSRPIRWLVAKLDDEVVPLRLAGVGRGRAPRPAAPLRGRPCAVGAATLSRRPARRRRDGRRGRSGGRPSWPGSTRPGRGRTRSGKLDEVVYLVEWPVVLEGRFDRRLSGAARAGPRDGDAVAPALLPGPPRRAPLEPRFLFVANGGDHDVVRRGNEEVLVGPARRRPVRLPARPGARPRPRWRRARPGQLPRRAPDRSRTKAARLGPLVERLCERNEPRRRRPRGGRPSRGALQGRPRLAASSASSPTSRATPARSTRGAAGEPDEPCAPRSRSTTGPTRRAGAAGAAPPAPCSPWPTRPTPLRSRSRRGLEPTGSRDPYGLRRAAAGIVAIALDRGYRIDPAGLVGDGAAGFVLDRLEPILLEEGVTVEEVRAARGVRGDRAGRRGRARPGAARVRRAPARRRARRVRPLRPDRRRDAAPGRRRGAPRRTRPSGTLARSAGRPAARRSTRPRPRPGASTASSTTCS